MRDTTETRLLFFLIGWIAAMLFSGLLHWMGG